jgi:hypothetical protein
MIWSFFLRSVNTCILRVCNAAAKPEYLSKNENISKLPFVTAIKARYVKTRVIENCQESMAVNCFGYFLIVPNFNTFLTLRSVNMSNLKV